MFKITKGIKFSRFFIRMWLGCVVMFIVGLVRIPPNSGSGKIVPLSSYLLLSVVIVGVLSFILSMVFSIKEGSKYGAILKVVLKLGLVGVLIIPTMIGMIIFLDADKSQWIIYPIFLICVILTIVFKVLIKKVLFPKKKLPSQP